MASTERQTTTSISEDAAQSDLSHGTDGQVKLHGQCGRHFLQNTTLPCEPALPPLGTYPKEVKAVSPRGMCTPAFTAALFTITKTRKQPKWLAMEEYISKTWCIHTIKYYSVRKRKEILTQTTAWMNSEDTMLREISQIQKHKHIRVHLQGH